MRKHLWNVSEKTMDQLWKICGLVGEFSANKILKLLLVENFGSFSNILRSFSEACVEIFKSVVLQFSAYSTAPIKVTTKEYLFSYKLIEGMS